MSLSTITIAGTISIILMFCMFVSVYKGQDHVHKDVLGICFMGGLTVLESILEMVSHDIESVKSLLWLNYFSNSFEYIINVLIEFSWVCFVYIKINGTLKKVNKKKLFLLSLPGVAITIMSLANFFTPVFYEISITNYYSRTNLYIIPVVIALFYMLYGFVVFEIKSRKDKRYSFYPTFAFLFPVILFQIIQLVADTISLTSVSVAIGVVAMYMCVKNEFACVDSLSGAFNKQYFERFILNEIKKHHKNKHLSGIMIDIDKFKSINDTYGHLVGDEAIRDAALLLIKTSRRFDNNLYVFRYGGDEFVLLQWVADENELLSNVSKIVEATNKFNAESKKQYSIEFSIGTAIYDSKEDTINSFISRMDKAMYDNKQAKKLAVK